MKIWGKFPPRWLANLTGGLSARGINILQGSARKVTPSLWEGLLTIAPAAGGELTEQLDFLEMARRESQSAEAAQEMHLENFTLVRRDDAIVAEIEAPDSVGFLKTLLKTFAFHSLFPDEVRIDTPAGRVRDSFRLKGIGGTAPSDTSFASLQSELDRHTVH